MAGTRETLRLDDSWQFHQGDVAAPLANKHIAGYMFNKAGWARGAARGNFDDSDWPTVTLPHDWSLDGPFHPDHHVNSGFLPRGIGWYRRTFALTEKDRTKTLSLRFDGIASYAKVYVNGHLLARSSNGYLPIDVDFTDVATYGDELNVVAVRVDATPMEGWWYEGAGIYRHVWLQKRHALHVADQGLQIESIHEADQRWRTHIRLTMGAAATEVNGWAHYRIVDADDRVVATGKDRCYARTGVFRHHVTSTTVRVDAPKLWRIGSPNLYRVHCEIFAGDSEVLVDSVSVRFGFRTIRFDPNEGFFLNDRHVLLKGTCNHQDHAGVGVAVPDSIHRFRVQRLKDMGCNAYRVGHHPPAKELLDACDELGMLVMDENRSFGSSPDHLAQLGAMVQRDANHPSVILWSICNEEAIQGTAVSKNIAQTMTREVKRLDESRPVTAAVSGAILNDGVLGDAVDVMAINYNFAALDAYHAKRPDKPVFSSETGCTLSTRGVYQTDSGAFQFASYDDDHAVWGSSAREAWRQIGGRPWMAGMFVWTGFDYRGEPSPHAWPSTVSHWGLMDLCGIEKDAFWRHKAYFSDEPVLHLLPHWNWTEGEPIRVQTLTNCDEVELMLNGRLVGRKTVDPIEMAEWTVDFEPGDLLAIGYRAGIEAARCARYTTGAACSLGVEIHPSCDSKPLADGETAWPITIFAVDTDGRPVPDTNAPLTVTVEGEAVLLGVGNGDPNGQFPNRGPSLPLFNGFAQAIVRSTATAGHVVIRAISPGLEDGVLSFDTLVSEIRPSVPPAVRKHLLTDWLMSPITDVPPDIATSAAVTDMNTWERVKAGSPQPAWSTRTGYALYRTTLKPPKAMATRGGRLAFSQIDGEAELFVDGVSQPAGMSIELSPRTTAAAIVVRLYGRDASAGINGPVELQLSPGATG